MAFPAKKKPDFLDDVVDDMGPPKTDDDSYGASMDDAGEDESDPEEAQQDRVMAAKQVMKALGVSGDASRFADALSAFVKACG